MGLQEIKMSVQDRSYLNLRLVSIGHGIPTDYATRIVESICSMVS